MRYQLRNSRLSEIIARASSPDFLAIISPAMKACRGRASMLTRCVCK